MYRKTFCWMLLPLRLYSSGLEGVVVDRGLEDGIDLTCCSGCGLGEAGPCGSFGVADASWLLMLAVTPSGGTVVMQ